MGLLSLGVLKEVRKVGRAFSKKTKVGVKRLKRAEKQGRATFAYVEKQRKKIRKLDVPGRIENAFYSPFDY